MKRQDIVRMLQQYDLSATDGFVIDGPWAFRGLEDLEAPAYLFQKGTGAKLQVGVVTAKVRNGGLKFEIALHEDYADLTEASFEVPMRFSIRRVVQDPRAPLSMIVEYNAETSRNWSKDQEINELFLRNVQNYLMDRLRHRGYLFVNDICDELGLDRTPEGQRKGWLYATDKDISLWWQRPINDGADVEIGFTPEEEIIDKI